MKPLESKLDENESYTPEEEVNRYGKKHFRHCGSCSHFRPCCLFRFQSYDQPVCSLACVCR